MATTDHHSILVLHNMATTDHCSIPVLTQLSNSRSPFHLHGNSRPPFQPHFYTWQQHTIIPHLFQQNVATTHYHSTHLSQYGNNTLLMPPPTSRQCGTTHYHPTPVYMKQKQKCMPPHPHPKCTVSDTAQKCLKKTNSVLFIPTPFL